jgi:hypothetical protein
MSLANRKAEGVGMTIGGSAGGAFPQVAPGAEFGTTLATAAGLDFVVSGFVSGVAPFPRYDVPQWDLGRAT